MLSQIIEDVLIESALFSELAGGDVAIGQFESDLGIIRRINVALFKFSERLCCHRRFLRGCVEPHDI